ncbi:MAG: type II toxin-antitoxin system VapC family toxin [Planctomycetia bacterium]|nr:type II toxin-antitoxin system VapC family toxin [Planctomycetia bacterium]
MILLDTDHLSVITDLRHRQRSNLLEKLRSAGDSIFVPIVSVEEQLRGWLAQIHRAKDVYHEVLPYTRLLELIRFLRKWEITPWDAAAAEAFMRLRALRIRIGTNDLKIASIALANDATLLSALLSANLRDFEQVPGLRVEGWLSN